MLKEIIVTVGTFTVAKNPNVLTCIGLGSCVAISLHDIAKRIGGLTHSMLPKYNDGKDKLNPAKYVDTSIILMLDELIQFGVRKSSIKAKIIGGGQMFNFQYSNILDVGNRNVQAALDTLKNEGIPIIAKDVGGNKGKTISFDIKTGKVNVRTNGKPLKIIWKLLLYA